MCKVKRRSSPSHPAGKWELMKCEDFVEKKREMKQGFSQNLNWKLVENLETKIRAII
jgi:hypothetical protein